MTSTSSTTTNTPASAVPAAPVSLTSDPTAVGASCPVTRLTLVHFLDLKTLQELQDSFTALTGLKTDIVDPAGKPLTVPNQSGEPARGHPTNESIIGPKIADSNGPIAAPIVVEGQELGSVRIESRAERSDATVNRQKLVSLLTNFGVPSDKVSSMLDAAEQAFAPPRAAAVQAIFLLANHLARLCYQEHQLRERVGELAAINKLSALLAGARDVQQILDTAVLTAAQVLGAKAATIRLLNEETRELTIKAVYGLSEDYLNKGPVHADSAAIARSAFAGEVVYVEDMTTDPRVIYPEDAEREGLVSFLVSGIIYHSRPIGLFQIYSATKQKFGRFDINLLQSISQITATAIESARLAVARQEGEKVQRQVRLAADVQRRMLPGTMPQIKAFDIGARYVPSFELGGDFYDFIDLDGHLGVAVCDVVGKGIAASLLMASVRASLRAYAQDVYDIDEIISRVNISLSRDTRSDEFATLFYGVLDPSTRRMTYCNAGHEPPLLLRDGRFTRLDVGGTVVGIDREQTYEKSIVQLEPGDFLLFYTDGLTDAQNFNNEKFGRTRILKAMRDTEKTTAQEAVNHLLWEMRRFIGLKPAIDDTTIVAVKVNPRS